MSAPEPVKIQLGARRERIALVIGVLLMLAAGIPLLSRCLARRRLAPASRCWPTGAHRPTRPRTRWPRSGWPIEQRADWLEMDVQQTKDGQLVVFHDLRMERTTNGRGAVRDLTLDQVRQLDAGSWYGPKFAGERVPTFEEVVALAREQGIRIFPEVKDPRLYPGHRGARGGRDRRQRLRGSAPSSSRSTWASLEKLRQAIRAEAAPGCPLHRRRPRSAATRLPARGHRAALGARQRRDRALVRDAHATGRQVVVWSVDGAQPAAADC